MRPNVHPCQTHTIHFQGKKSAPQEHAARIHTDRLSKTPAKTVCCVLHIILCMSFTVLFSGCSKEDNSFDLGKIAENSRTKFAPEDGYQFQQLYESEDLPNYDRVEVGVGSLDFIDTSLMYADTTIEKVNAQDLEQGIIDATLANGPQNLYVKGFAQVDVLNASSDTITVSGFGPTIKQAFEVDQLTFEVGQE